MKYIGIDPGRTIGVVVYEDLGELGSWVIRAFETPHAFSVADLIIGEIEHPKPVIVIEDFIGNGPRSTDAIHTLKVLGFLDGFARWHGFDVRVQVPQYRKPFKAKAATLVKPGHHYTDAMAHVLACIHLEGTTS